MARHDPRYRLATDPMHLRDRRRQKRTTSTKSASQRFSRISPLW